MNLSQEMQLVDGIERFLASIKWLEAFPSHIKRELAENAKEAIRAQLEFFEK